MKEQLKLALAGMCSDHGVRIDMSKPFSLLGGTCATNGKGALLVEGVPCDHPAEAVFEQGLPGFLGGDGYEPVAWPNLSRFLPGPPHEKCTNCHGGARVPCGVCGGSGECYHCHGAEGCQDCGGSGKWECEDCNGTGKEPEPGPDYRGPTQPAWLRIGAAKIGIDAARLAGDLKHLTPTKGSIGKNGSFYVLRLAGDGWRYLLCGLSMESRTDAEEIDVTAGLADQVEQKAGA